MAKRCLKKELIVYSDEDLNTLPANVIEADGRHSPLINLETRSKRGSIRDCKEKGLSTQKLKITVELEVK